MNAKAAERGSSKLFSIEADDYEGIAKALGAARSDYEVKWWWKYGQPAIDLIRAQFDVSPQQLGSFVTRLMTMNGPDHQVTAQCFPNGLPKPDLFRVEVDFRQAR